MEFEGDQGSQKKKRRTGARCMVYGCSNEAQHGFFMHKLPGKKPSSQERYSSLQRAWISFIGRKRQFDTQVARTYMSDIIVCSGHFRREDYDLSQSLMYELGQRTHPPSLKKTAVPSIDEAQHPFRQTSSSSASTSTFHAHASVPSYSHDVFPCTSYHHSSSPTQASVSSTLSVPVISSSSYTIVTTTVTLMSSSSSSTTTSAVLHTPRTSSRESIYIRKKEMTAIYQEFDKAEEETKRKAAKEKEDEQWRDIENRSKCQQCSSEMRDHKVGTRKFKSCIPRPPRPTRRSSKSQTRPICFRKGVQASLMERPPTNKVLVQVADMESQTGEESHEEEEKDKSDPEDNVPFVDNLEKDPNYEPDTDSISSDEEIVKVTQAANIRDEEKFIVFESNLLELFRFCDRCHAEGLEKEKIRPKSFGSQLRIRTLCMSCGHVSEWDSQPRIGNLFAGNILLSAAILFGGASPTKVLRLLRHMNLKAISNRTFLDHQTDYLQPAIMRVWHQEQRRLVRSIGRDKTLIAGGDGRADSPGHSAKYGSYVIMDLKLKKILDQQLVQSNEVTSSNAMEKEGLDRCLRKVKEMGLKVGTLVTDRHASVAKLVREQFPEIDHRYDVWHLAKGIQKKLTALSKLKDCQDAAIWRKAIVYHVYWCASSTPDGDGNMIEAKYRSIFNHIRGIHSHDSEIFPRCQHGEDYPRKEWLREESKLFLKMSDDLLKTRLVNDIKKMSPIGQTSSVEAFHSVLLYWVPKMLAYSYTGMKCRLILAGLHWNENSDRDQGTKHSDGTPLFKLTYQKAKDGRPTLSKVLTACTFDYVDMLMEETLSLVSRKQKLRDDMPELKDMPSLASKYDDVRPSKDQAIQEAHLHRRFADSK